MSLLKVIKNIRCEANPDEKQRPDPPCCKVVVMEELFPRSMHQEAPHPELKDDGEHYPDDAD